MHAARQGDENSGSCVATDMVHRAYIWASGLATEVHQIALSLRREKTNRRLAHSCAEVCLLARGNARESWVGTAGRVEYAGREEVTYQRGISVSMRGNSRCSRLARTAFKWVGAVRNVWAVAKLRDPASAVRAEPNNALRILCTPLVWLRIDGWNTASAKNQSEGKTQQLFKGREFTSATPEDVGTTQG